MQRKKHKSNKIAKQNGLKAEKEALPLIFAFMDEAEKITFVNKLFDVLVNDTVPVEIKSCQQYVCDASASQNKRSGRFRLDKKQHEYLVENSGYYLFVVYLEEGHKLFKLVKAEKVPFRWTITWWKLPALIEEDTA